MTEEMSGVKKREKSWMIIRFLAGLTSGWYIDQNVEPRVSGLC